MNIQDLPDSLLKASKKIVETQDVLESCVSCGAVVGSCPHTSVVEDILSSMNVPDEDEPEEKLSGEVEDVIINPEYKTFTSRRP